MKRSPYGERFVLLRVCYNKRMRNKKSFKVLITATIVSGVMLVAIIIAGYMIIRQNQQNNVAETARNKLRGVMLSAQQTTKRSVVSKLGFTVYYDNALFSASAHEATAKSNSDTYNANTYKDDELKVSRGYNLVEVGFKKSDPGLSGKSKLANSVIRPYLSVHTSRKRDYFDRSTMPEQYKDTSKYSDLDLMASVKVKQFQENDPNDECKVSDITISGKKFKLVDSTRKSRFSQTEQIIGHRYSYMTVQNGRPYWLEMTVYSAVPENDKAEIESLIASVSFQKPDESLLTRADDADSAPAIKLAAQSSSSSSSKGVDDKDITNIPYEIDDSSLINVVARNQIATVRVGAYRCADVRYTAENGAQLNLTGLCVRGIGSGSIVSSDGYIATNGHVTDIRTAGLFDNGIQDSMVDGYLSFLVRAGYLTQSEANQLLARAESGDGEAASTLMSFIDRVPNSNITISNDQSSYIIQTSNDPIRWDANGWVATKTNLMAKKIDSEVETNDRAFNRNSKKTDVAILKADGEFPAVELGDINSLHEGSQITALGFPWIVDKGLDTTNATTVPTATQGRVDGIESDAGGHTLFSMSAKIASGNSGGPAFDDSGRQVGINTYGSGGDNCEDSGSKNNCFGSGLARDIKDLKAMARKNNIRLSSDGELTKLWKDGLEEFSHGQYSRAATYFEKLNSKYPNNYLVSRMLQISQNTADNYVEEPSTESVPSEEYKGDPNDVDTYRAYIKKEAESALGKKTNKPVIIAVIVIGSITGIMFTAGICLIIYFAVRRKPALVPRQLPPQPPFPPQNWPPRY